MTTLRNQRPAVATLDVRIARVGAKAVDPHYTTPEHRQWRAEVIRRAGGRCQGVGCQRAGRLFADHIVELRDNGAPFDPANGQALCGSCHSTKTAENRAKRQSRPT